MRYNKLASIGLLTLATTCCAPNPQLEHLTPPMEFQTIPLQEGKTLQLSNYVANRAIFLYRNNETELPTCLLGGVVEKEGNFEYYLEDVVLPLWIETDQRSASFDVSVCKTDPNYIGVMHNHPNKELPENCRASIVDYERFIKDKDAQVEMVVCWVDDFTNNFLYTLYTKPII